MQTKRRKNNEGATPLHVAAEQGDQAVVKWLLDAGAEKEKANNEGATPLRVGTCPALVAGCRCRRRQQTPRAPHRCILLLSRVIRQLWSACWMPVLTKRR